jgi:hypothetical protein
MARLDDVFEGGTVDEGIMAALADGLGILAAVEDFFERETGDEGKMGTLDDIVEVDAWAVDVTETISGVALVSSKNVQIIMLRHHWFTEVL